MKKVIIIGVILFLLSAGAFWVYMYQSQIQKAGSQFNSNRVQLTSALSYAYYNTNATNLVYVTGATSTYQFSSSKATQFDLHLTTIASSTVSELQWFYEYSDDGSNWYSESPNSTSGAVKTHGPTKLVNKWVPGLTATSSLNIQVTNLNSKYMRIGFASQTATTSNIGLFAEGVLKQEY